MSTIDAEILVDVSRNRRDLLEESLRVVSLLVGAFGYTWLFLAVWSVTGANLGWEAWVGSLALLASAAAGYVARTRYPRSASGLLIVGCMTSIALAMVSYRLPDFAYVFAVPVTFASVLLGPVGTALTGSAAILLTVIVSTSKLGVPVLSKLVLLPLIINALNAVASWLSERNLHTALEWAWNAYERARYNERMVRERRAELRRVLKSLDEATHRMERMNHMLEVARDQAEGARRLKQQFAQTVSHELRTPLNLIVGFTEMMAQSPEYYGGPLPAPYVRDLSVVHRNACHLRNLVNDVLDLSRIEAVQMSLVLEWVDPGVMAMEAVNTARSLIEARGLSLLVNIEADLPTIRVDPTRIRQVLLNLLNNAAQYTEKGSVTVGVLRQAQEVTFRVTDTGVGIAPEDIPKVFDEFHQLDTGNRRNRGGAGLGLAISRSLVELHGGHLWLESELGRGSSFSFALPTEHLDTIASKTDPSVQRDWIGSSPTEDKHVLLAVTRSQSAAGLLTRYMRATRTVVASSLDQARAMARQLLPQAVVVDTASVRVEADQRDALVRMWDLPGVPVIACPLPGEEPLRQCLDVEGYLIKPVSRVALWDVVRRFGEEVDRVLVVDDDRDFVRFLARLLDNPVRRYEVGMAYNGQEALQMLQRWAPDLVLLDLGLPDMDGADVIERMEANPRWQDIPIVVVSGRDEIVSLPVLRGTMSIGKANGLVPGELIRWIAGVVDTAIPSSTGVSLLTGKGSY